MKRRAGVSPARLFAIIVVSAVSLAACSGGGGGTTEGATNTSLPADTQPATGAPGAGSGPAFCQMSPEVRERLLSDGNDPEALRAGLDAFIDLINQAMEGAPQQVRNDLTYMVTRYQQVKDALAAGQSPEEAVGVLKEQREELGAAATTFATYTQERCRGA